MRIPSLISKFETEEAELSRNGCGNGGTGGISATVEEPALCTRRLVSDDDALRALGIASLDGGPGLAARANFDMTNNVQTQMTETRGEPYFADGNIILITDEGNR